MWVVSRCRNVFPFQMTQWTVHLSVFWRYWQRRSTTSVSTVLTRILLHPCLVLLTACSSIRVSASSRMQGDSLSHHHHTSKSLCCYVITWLSLRRLNSSALFPSSRGNYWCQFPGSFLLPSTLIRIPVPVFLLILETRVPILVKYHIDSLNRFHEMTHLHTQGMNRTWQVWACCNCYASRTIMSTSGTN